MRIVHGFLIAALALPVPVRADEELLLVVDAPRGLSDHLSKFRRFDDLRISGSSEFSPAGLDAVRARLPVQRFTVVDLRQESHGFAGGLPVSWEANHNWANVALSPEQVRADERHRLDLLEKQDRVTLTRLDERWHRENMAKIFVRPGQVMTEEEVVRARGLDYARFTVRDHSHPNDADVDRFVALVKALPADGWMHFHCKAGVGRTTTFMAMAEMIETARRVPAARIVKRQSDAAGYDLEKVGAPGTWSGETSRQRRDFLYAFHDYCVAESPAFARSWSEYARARRASAAANASGSAPSTTPR